MCNSAWNECFIIAYIHFGSTSTRTIPLSPIRTAIFYLPNVNSTFAIQTLMALIIPSQYPMPTNQTSTSLFSFLIPFPVPLNRAHLNWFKMVFIKTTKSMDISQLLYNYWTAKVWALHTFIIVIKDIESPTHTHNQAKDGQPATNSRLHSIQTKLITINMFLFGKSLLLVLGVSVYVHVRARYMSVIWLQWNFRVGRSQWRVRMSTNGCSGSLSFAHTHTHTNKQTYCKTNQMWEKWQRERERAS